VANDDGRAVNPMADVTLEELARGAAGELFEREWTRVLANAMDPNTDPKKKRVVTLKFIFIPNEDRESGTLLTDANSTIAPAKPGAMPLFIGTRHGQPVAVSRIQTALFTEDASVTPIPATAKAAG
jgi:hypothetical protein